MGAARLLRSDVMMMMRPSHTQAHVGKLNTRRNKALIKVPIHHHRRRPVVAWLDSRGVLVASSTRPSGPHPLPPSSQQAAPTTTTMEGGALSGGQMACAMLFGTATITYLGLEVSRFRVLVRVS